MASKSDDGAILAACSAIENLWFAAHPSVNIPELNLPIRRIHCNLYSLFRSAPIDFTHQFFASITHLEIFDVRQNIELEVWSRLTRLPHLTHVAFNSPLYMKMCLALLPTWETLRVLVILYVTGTGEKLLERYSVPELAQDPRFVVIVCPNYCEDWFKGATMGRDYWSRAEDFIAKRKSREINPLDYHISETAKDAQQDD